MSKKDFFRLFWEAYINALTIENISSGWAKTGLHPYNPDTILRVFQKTTIEEQRPSSSESNTSVLSASDWRKIRKLFKEVVTEVVDPQAKVLNNTVMKLATDNIILRAEVQGLSSATYNEKKKWQRGKT